MPLSVETRLWRRKFKFTAACRLILGLEEVLKDGSSFTGPEIETFLGLLSPLAQAVRACRGRIDVEGD